MTQTKIQILIVEDQKLWREQLFAESQELGYTVFLAATKEEALALLDKYQFDLAVVDINLTAVAGNTDGLAVTDHIKSTGAKTPIIVVSGTEGGFRSLHERPYQVFAEIQKDLFDLDDFISQVERAITGTEV